MLRCGVGGICCCIRQLSAKSRGLLRLIQTFIFGREVFSRGANETRRGAASPGQDFIAGQGLGFCILITILAEQSAT
ncbi:MAG: hypothetical protein DMG73_16890 [Acidobacteria bacterium]|nr:MAG: hypothetical protein DMG73_16890 [Acidobacteriota bacterium]